jgi:hypothetical protein
MDGVEKRGSLAAAILCEQIRRSENHHQSVHIGRLCLPTSFGLIGQFVFVRYQSEADCIVEHPMTESEIKEQRARGSLLTTWVPVIGFPRAGVEIFLTAAEIDRLQRASPNQKAKVHGE